MSCSLQCSIIHILNKKTDKQVLVKKILKNAIIPMRLHTGGKKLQTAHLISTMTSVIHDLFGPID